MNNSVTSLNQIVSRMKRRSGYNDTESGLIYKKFKLS